MSAHSPPVPPLLAAALLVVRRTNWQFVLPLLGAALLVACGPRPTLPAVAPPFVLKVVPPTPTPEGTSLSLLAPYVDEEAARFQPVLEAFTARSGMPVEFTGASQIPDELRRALQAGRPPNVVVLPKPNWLGELAGTGVLAPLAPEAAAAMRANYTEAWQRLASHEGVLYGVPLRANSKSLVWYRPAALAAVHRSAPQTWDEWLALNRALAAGGTSPLAVPGGAAWPLTDWFENVLLRTAGPTTYLQLVRHEIPWTDPAVRIAFERLDEMWREEWLAGGREGAAAAPLAETLAQTFDPGDPTAAMVLGQGWIVPFLKDKHPTLDPGRDLDFFPFPTINPAFNGAVEDVHIAVALNTRPEAMALLAHLASPEAAARWVAQGTIVSPNTALLPTAYPDQLTRREAAHLIEAQVFVPDLSDTVPRAVSEALAAGLQRFLTRPDALEAILTEIEAAARRTQG